MHIPTSQIPNHYDDCSSDQRYMISMNMNMMMIMMKITLVSVPKSDDDNCQSRIKYCIQDYDEDDKWQSGSLSTYSNS